MKEVVETYTLKEPVEFGKEKIEKLEFRAPKAKDFRKLPLQPNMGDMLDLAGRLANQPPSVMDEISAEDMMRVLDIVGKFMPDGPATGENS